MFEDQIFSAFRDGDSAPLLSIIHNNSTWTVLEHIAQAFPAYVRLHPGDSVRAANALNAIYDSPDLLSVPATNSESATREFNTCIYDVITAGFSDNEDHAKLEPGDAYLMSAVVSAAASKTGLCRSPTQAGQIYTGLQFPGSEYRDYFTPDQDEVHAVHACIHLLLSGPETVLWPGRPLELAGVLPALLALEQNEVVEHAGGRALLELTINEARAGFKKNISYDEIWKTLFPNSTPATNSHADDHRA